MIELTATDRVLLAAYRERVSPSAAAKIEVALQALERLESLPASEVTRGDGVEAMRAVEEALRAVLDEIKQ